MTEKQQKQPEPQPEPQVATVKVGDEVKIEGAGGLAVLPDGTVVTCRNTFTVQHVGRHTIGGVAYDVLAVDPAAADTEE